MAAQLLASVLHMPGKRKRQSEDLTGTLLPSDISKSMAPSPSKIRCTSINLDTATTPALHDRDVTAVKALKQEELQSNRSEGSQVSKSESDDPVGHWVETFTWPASQHTEEDGLTGMSRRPKKARTTSHNVALLSQSGSAHTASKPGSSKSSALLSYTSRWQSVTEQNGSFEHDSDENKDEVAAESVAMYEDLLHSVPDPPLGCQMPDHWIENTLKSCRLQNEARIARDVTPMLIPPIQFLLAHGITAAGQCAEELGTEWKMCLPIHGPKPRSDLAIGLSNDCFSHADFEKLKSLEDSDASGRVAEFLSYPFLMCEIKGINGDLRKANRQNTHSCSIAVLARIRLEQLADVQRLARGMKPIAPSLHGRVFVYSISHNVESVKIYCHFGKYNKELDKWKPARHKILDLPLLREPGNQKLVNNFSRNVLAKHGPRVLQEVKQTLELLPNKSDVPNRSSAQGSGAEVLGANMASILQNNRVTIEGQAEQIRIQAEELRIIRAQVEARDEASAKERKALMSQMEAMSMKMEELLASKS